MPSTMKFFLLSVFVTSVSAGNWTLELANECEPKEGNCVSDIIGQEGCRRQLPYRCPRQEDICCEEEILEMKLHPRVTEAYGRSTTSNCSCGQINSYRIVGGKEVSPKNKYPWMVGLFKVIYPHSFFCGGTIINDRFVLTAAHCLYAYQSDVRVNARDIGVVIGDHNQYSSSDNVPGVTGYVEVSKVIPHEKYRHNSQFYGHDIGLLKLKIPIDFTKRELKPLCLPADDSQTYAGKEAIAIGWGQLDYDNTVLPANLMEVTVPIYMQTRCRNNYSNKIKITKHMICAGRPKKGLDVCKGDSGGPLFLKEGSKYVIVGITSFGIKCANLGKPGVYARVSKYLKWINYVSKSGKSCL